MQYYTNATDYRCSSVDLFALIVETFTGNGTWRTLPKYQDQATRRSIFNLLASSSVLTAGASCVVLVNFDQPVDGLLVGQLVVTDSDGGSPQVAQLYGTGVS